MISPLASAAQVFTICKPGDEIPLPREPKENVSLLDKKLTNMKWTDRKAYFHDLSHLSEYYFEPGLIYTISCYSHMISPTSYSIHALGMKWGIHQYVPSPIQIATVILPVTRTPIASNDTSDAKTLKNEIKNIAKTLKINVNNINVCIKVIKMINLNINKIKKHYMVVKKQHVKNVNVLKKRKRSIISRTINNIT